MPIPTIVLLSLLLLAATLPGCPQAPSTESSGEPVRVGVIYPFSGANAASGSDLRAGIELALEIVNGSFDLPMPTADTTGLFADGRSRLEVVYRDSRGDPDTAAAAVEALVAEVRVTALLGCYSSTVTAAASERAEVLQVPFVNAASTSPTLTRRGFRWFFRATPDDEIFAQNFFAFLTELATADATTVPRDLVLVYENRLWGTGVAQAEKRLARQNAFRVRSDIAYDATAPQFLQELEAVVAAHREPAIIMQASYLHDAIAFMQGYKARGVNPTAILAMNAGFVSPEFLRILGADAEHVFSREVWSPDLARHHPLAAAVNTLFRDRFGRDMTGQSARAFTALVVLADAINRAGSTRPEALRSALLATALGADEVILPWQGVAFDADSGQNTLGRGIIVQIQDGHYTAVWPRELASRPAVWPMPPWSQRQRETP